MSWACSKKGYTRNEDILATLSIYGDSHCVTNLLGKNGLK